MKDKTYLITAGKQWLIENEYLKVISNDEIKKIIAEQIDEKKDLTENAYHTTKIVVMLFVERTDIKLPDFLNDFKEIKSIYEI